MRVEGPRGKSAMTERSHWLREAISIIALSLACGTTALLAQDISGGAGDVGKRPSSPPVRKRPAQPKPAATHAPRAQSQPEPETSAPVRPTPAPSPVAQASPEEPKIDMSEQMEDALELGNTARAS